MKDYKKILEGMVNIITSENSDVVANIRAYIDENCPELKESEDKKIKKELISFVRNDGWRFIKRTKEEKESWIDWLEKQGEHTKFSQITRITKSADKVKSESEIEEGKWYICTQTYTLRGKIVVIKGQTYKSNQDGAIEGKGGRLFIDNIDGKALNYFKPWTIQDVKDGDVLFIAGETFILKSIDEKGNAKCYFAYDSEDGLREGKYYFIGSAAKCKPATKEQRSVLLKAMADAGYTFDFNKKELRKIEQAPAWSEEDEATLDNIISDIRTLQSKSKCSPSDRYYAIFDEEIDWLKSVRQRIGE